MNELDKLKIEREKTIAELAQLNKNKRYKLKKAEEIARLGYLNVSIRAIKKLIKKLGLQHKKNALKKDFYRRQLAFDSEQTIYLAIRITGGVGDVVCIARWLYQIKNYFVDKVIIDVFFNSPEIVHFILQSIGVRAIFNDSILRYAQKQYDAVLTISQLISFDETHFKQTRLNTILPEFINFINTLKNNQTIYKKYIEAHPLADGLFADLVVKQGLNRKDFLSVISGFEKPKTQLPIKLTYEPILKQLGLSIVSYITIHDGWDANFKGVIHRPTKSYPLHLFGQLVSLIKHYYPDIKIVQLGGKTGSVIEGIDTNLKEKLSFEQSTCVLKHALVHIDTESGLVHLASSLATPCVVIFGSTNFDYYSYQENSNLKPKQCGNCMCVTDTWMETCPLQYIPPKCTQSILPSDVLQATQQIINERLNK